MRFSRERYGARILRFGREILARSKAAPGGTMETSSMDSVDDVVAALEEWYRKIGTPVTFEEGGITAPEVDAYTEQALQLAEFWGVSGYSENDIHEIYRLAGA